MKIASFCFFTVVMATCLACVEDLVNEETCNWICDTKSEDVTSGDLEKLISEGGVINLEVEYTERVDKTCENELQAFENTSTTIWLKKMSNTSSGALDLLSQVAFEEMYSGRILFGYKHIHVSCILKLLARNHSLRLSINTPQSVVYLVEQFANRSNTREKFLTLMRRNERIQVTFDVSLGNSSVTSARHGEYTVNVQLWLFCYVVLVIVIAFYYSVIVVAYRPSEIVVNKDNRLPHSVALSEKIAPQEHLDATLPESGPHKESNPSCIPQFPGIIGGLSDMPTEEGNATVAFPIVQAEGYDSGKAEMVGSSVKTSQRSLPPDVSSASSTSRIHDNAINDGSRCERNFGIETIPIQCEFNDDLAASADTPRGDNSIDTRNRYRRDTVENKPTDYLVNIPERSENVPETRQRVASESTVEIRMIPKGKNPVALGSLIGNCFFVNSPKRRDGNKYLDMLKDMVTYVLCYISPTLLIFGFGDLSLLILKYNSSRLADFPNDSLIASVFTKWRIGWAVTFLILHCLRSFCVRKLASKSINAWRSCFVHCNHLPVILRLKCFCNPCDECKNSPPDCPTPVDIPNNIVHNMEKVTESFLKHCNFFAQCVINFYMTTEFNAVVKVLSIILPLTPAIFVFIAALLFINFFMDILLSSPIVCSCSPRIWFLKESLQDRFRGPRVDVVCDIVEALLKLAFFAWLVYYSIYDAIRIVNACIVFSSLLSNNFSDELIKHVFGVLFIHIYCFSCYSWFKSFYSKLVEKIRESYMEQYDEIKNTEPNNLVNYEQGDHIAIEYKLFEFAIDHKAIKKPILNRVVVMLLKIGGMFLISVVFFPITSTPSPWFQVVFVLGALLYKLINYINDTTFDISEKDLEKIVKDFIKEKK